MRIVLYCGLALACVAADARTWPQQGDVYVGQYMCGSAAWLLLHIDSANADGEVSAVFHFVYPTSTQHGAYQMHGSFRKGLKSNLLELEPGEWIHKAAKVVKVGVIGVFTDDGLSYKGEILHSNCRGFQVNKTTVDVSPPGTLLHMNPLVVANYARHRSDGWWLFSRGLCAQKRRSTFLRQKVAPGQQQQRRRPPQEAKVQSTRWCSALLARC